MTGKELCEYIKKHNFEDFTLKICLYEGPSKSGRWIDFRNFENIEIGDVSYSDKVFNLDISHEEA